jgi:RNA polymerase sigma factor (sigma-70 family)
VQPAVVERLHRQAHAERWDLAAERFASALERSAKKAFATPPDGRDLERYVVSLHLEDLALACACADGHEGAWEHFVREHRPVLYRAADAIEPSGAARDLADSLYGELFGMAERDGHRRSLFEYFHGRSSLSTWLRAVLAQRHVDRIRNIRRFEPLPSEEEANPVPSSEEPRTVRVAAYLELMRRAVSAAVTRLLPKDRLRLGYYYAEELTLAQIGRALGEHEATVSRNLSRARKDIRRDVEQQLRDRERMSPEQIEECFAMVVEDVGPLDVADLLGTAPPATADAGGGTRKKDGAGRSKERAEGASA